MNIPVIETEGYQGSSEVRLDARFLKDHKVFLLGEITPDSAVELTQKLIYLENEPGKKGHRHILPHSRTMIHEPLIASGIGGSATSIRHLSESIMDTKQLVNKILAFHVGKTPEEIDRETAFDNYMNPEESVAFGICDDITTDIF